MERREARAKLFKRGGRRAVRSLKPLRFEPQKEVRIRREGEGVVLEPDRPTWSARFLALAGSAGDFSYPEEPPAADHEPELD